MSTPNPLAPQGSLLEKQARSKSSLQVAALIVGLHVFVLGGFLILGCKKEEAKAPDTGATNDLAGVTGAVAPDTNAPVLGSATNALPGGPAAGMAAGGGLGNGLGGVVGAVSTNGAAANLGGDVAGTGAGAGSTGAATTGATEYKVQKGDIAAILAKKHGITLKALKEANPNVNLAKLKVDQTLQIPGSTGVPAGEAKAGKSGGATETAADTASSDSLVYRVKGGDNLGKIAKKHGTTVKAIRALNNLASDSIQVGQKLKLPVKGAPVTAPTTPDSVPAANPVPTAAPVPTGTVPTGGTPAK